MLHSVGMASSFAWVLSKTSEPISLAFLSRPSHVVARALLGHHLVRRLKVSKGNKEKENVSNETKKKEEEEEEEVMVVGRIVETEAYGGLDDSSSHSHRYKNKGLPMRGEPGHAYVYLIYGMHNCINIVSHPPNSIGGVLIRAIAPLDSASATHMRANYIRGSSSSTKPLKLRDHHIASGPGRVCRALDIDTDRFNARPILDPTSELFVAYSPEAILSPSSSSSSPSTTSSSSFPLAVRDDEVVCTPRVRVDGEKKDRDIAWRFFIRDNSSVSEPKMFSVVNYALNTEIDSQTNKGEEVKLVETTKTKTKRKTTSSSSSVVKRTKVGGERGKVKKHDAIRGPGKKEKLKKDM